VSSFAQEKIFNYTIVIYPIMGKTMEIDNETFLKRWKARIHKSPIGRLFWDKKFVYYTWIGIFVSLLNIFFLWLLIDIVGISTIVSSILVVGVTFILRYILLIYSKVL